MYMEIKMLTKRACNSKENPPKITEERIQNRVAGLVTQECAHASNVQVKTVQSIKKSYGLFIFFSTIVRSNLHGNQNVNKAGM